MIEDLRFSGKPPDVHSMNRKFIELLNSGDTEEAVKVSNEIKFIELTQSNIRLASQIKALEIENSILSQTIVSLRNQVEEFKVFEKKS